MFLAIVFIIPSTTTVILNLIYSIILMMSKTPTRRFVNRENKEVEQCCICLEDIIAGDVIVTGCNHGFHRGCMEN
jgi:hypothetical protein